MPDASDASTLALVAAFAGQTLRVATPLTLGALSGIWS